MFFKTFALGLLVECFVLLKVESTTNPDKDKETTAVPTTLDLISSDLDAAKEIFKRNYARLHKIDINDLELDLKPQIFDGSYFVSGILQLKFSFKDEDKKTTSSVLLKIPQIGAMYQHGEKNFYYVKEKYMYEEVIPLMYNRTPYETISPIFYGSTDSGCIVLENLRESGYRGYPKGSLLTKTECEVVWKSIARFHALSTKHLDEISTRIDLMSVMDRCQNQWVTEVFPPVAEKLKKHVLSQHSENIKLFFQDFLKDFCPLSINPAFSPDTTGRNVLLHGDLHLSNILFRYESTNKEIKCKFIDFQICRRGSPVIDLMYFTIISVHVDVFDKNRDTLFSLYLDEFNNTLQEIGVPEEKQYTLGDFETDWEKFKTYFFFILIGVAPPLWAGDHQTKGSNSAEENHIDELFKSEKYRSAFKGWIKHLLPKEYA